MGAVVVVEPVVVVGSVFVVGAVVVVEAVVVVGSAVVVAAGVVVVLVTGVAVSAPLLHPEATSRNTRATASFFTV